jgi:hypothetical protein
MIPILLCSLFSYGEMKFEPNNKLFFVIFKTVYSRYAHYNAR